jgi:hypothetical protein
MVDLYLDLLLAVPATTGLYLDLLLAVPTTGLYADTGATQSPSNGRASERVAVFDDLSAPNEGLVWMAVTGMAAEVYVDTTSAVAPLLADLAGRFAGVVVSYVEFMAHYAVLAGLYASLLAVLTTGDLLDSPLLLQGLSAVLSAGDAPDGFSASLVAVATVGHVVDDPIPLILPLGLSGGYARSFLAGLTALLGADLTALLGAGLTALLGAGLTALLGAGLTALLGAGLTALLGAGLTALLGAGLTALLGQGT